MKKTITETISKENVTNEDLYQIFDKCIDVCQNYISLSFSRFEETSWYKKCIKLHEQSHNKIPSILPHTDHMPVLSEIN